MSIVSSGTEQADQKITGSTGHTAGETSRRAVITYDADFSATKNVAASAINIWIAWHHCERSALCRHLNDRAAWRMASVEPAAL